MDTSILAASADKLQHASEVQESLSFPLAYAVTREQAATVGGWWEDQRSIMQPSEFILDSRGNVISATYSTGPVGRLMPEDALKMIEFVAGRKGKD